jgi:2-polyprenyl-6-methoxyphenol hydroxylase-like FAD-dependent oxidoreductase
MIQTQCCVVGGGPAGLMLGCLLARAGVEIVVVEKHADFFRDFRGDTIHPSTLELLYELGQIEEFRSKVKPQEYPSLDLVLDGHVVHGPDFTTLPTHCKFIAIAPQWDFLNFIADFAKRYPTFQLMMSTDATELIQENGVVVGVKAQQGEEAIEIRANLVVSADGRSSKLREQVGLVADEVGVPVDVLWFHLPKTQEDPQGHILGRVGGGTMMVTIDRGTYFQCGQVIAKGGFSAVQGEGLPAFCQKIVKIAPFLEEATHSLKDWDQVKLLSVQINRLPQWAVPGYLCIGDAAHAMSPAGGVGVNFAVQDAVATSNLLAEKLRTGSVTLEDLNLVQKRRERPVKIIQRLQAFAHKKLFNPEQGFKSRGIGMFAFRTVVTLFAPIVRRKMARMIGLGPLPEHVETREVSV